jgi:hypothetical protein
MLPDWSAVPAPVPYAPFTNPQSLNLYTYVGNNPINAIDADGHVAGNGNTYNIVPFSGAWGCVQNSMQDGCNGDSFLAVNDGGQQTAAEQAQESDSTAAAQQQSTDNSGNVVYKPGTPQASPAVSKVLSCTANCSDETLRVTSTSEAIPQHPAGTPHRKGEAADVTVKPGTAKRVLACAATCGAKFGQDEGAHPIPGHTTGPHVHLQTVPGKRGGRGDLPRETPEPRSNLRNEDDQ